MNDSEVFTRWRRMRDESLAVPYGWLTLSSYQWLPAEPGTIELLPGNWSAGAGGATLESEPGDGFTTPDGDPLGPVVSARVGEDESIHWVRRGEVLVELGMHGGRYMIRTRSREHPRRAAFAGVPVFDYSPHWVLPGSYRPYAEPRTATLDSCRADTSLVAEFDGEVELRFGGRTVSLAVREPGDGSLNLAFFDATNGGQTAPWRFVSFPAPGPDGAVLVDFNRTLNYPMAFTEFASCPAPLPGNTIPVAVTAGEQQPT